MATHLKYSTKIREPYNNSVQKATNQKKPISDMDNQWPVVIVAHTQPTLHKRYGRPHFVWSRSEY